ncbi:MAG: hypothetical protein DRP56_03985 [Planctomycetota bacterium]|nr:MAG: hypothetical protein DRP56_03985 [Planctomycetota bacterium]
MRRAVTLTKQQKPLKIGFAEYWLLRWYDSTGKCRSKSLGRCDEISKEKAIIIRDAMQIENTQKLTPGMKTHDDLLMRAILSAYNDVRNFATTMPECLRGIPFLQHGIPENIGFVYFLTDRKRGEIVSYVGETVRVYDRARVHKKNGKQFDYWAFILCPHNWRNRVEKYYIDIFDPPDNKDKSNERHCSIRFRGKNQSLSKWAYELGIDYKTLHGRIRRGWSIEKTMTTPMRKARML